MSSSSDFDFIGIGDTVIDAFIRLSVGHIEESAKGAQLCIPYGAKVPYDEVHIVPAVGNSANATVCASRLGLKTALISFLGDDKHGKDCLEQLEKENVATQFITQEKDKPTNYHYVLWYGDDRTILVKHTDFTVSLPNIGNPKWLYLSSLGPHTKGLHAEIVKYMKEHTDVKLAFQPGTFQLNIKDELTELYKEVDVVCVNKEEAEDLLDMQGKDVEILLDGLQAMGPNIVLITDGPNGAYIKYEKGYFNMPVYPDIAKPFERTGAGDAFFSTCIAYLAQGKDIEYAITRAPINSMNVVQHIGAQEGLLNEEKIEDYLYNAPTNYKLIPIVKEN